MGSGAENHRGASTEPLAGQPDEVKGEKKRGTPSSQDLDASAEQLDFAFWFDLSCPYAHLAAGWLRVLEARTGVMPRPEPFWSGALRTEGEPDIPQKQQHTAWDLLRHARALEVPFHPPERAVDSRAALKAILALERDRYPLIHAFFRARFAENKDLEDPKEMKAVIEEAGYDHERVVEAAARPEATAALAHQAERARAAGVFASPTFVVGKERFFGLSQLPLAEAALGGAPTSPFPDVRKEELRPVDVWFDYASPFSYIGVSQAKVVLGRALRFRPMLLGAIFKEVGQVMVPMFEFSEEKRSYFMEDLHRQAKSAGLPFSFPSRFPVSTVPALRMTLAAQGGEGRDGQDLIERVFRAYWVEGQDISDLSVLQTLANEVGLDGASLLAKTKDPDVKASLFASTQRALRAGVFGAPTFVVQRSDGASSLYWGADRLHLAAQAAAGHTAVF